MSTPSQRLNELGITLPEVPKPVAAYVPFATHGDLVFTSGQLPLKDGKLAYVGKAGREYDAEAAQDAARICAINAIAVGAQAAGGVDNIKRVIKVVVYVAAAEGFTSPHVVANGASELLQDVFGEAGIHARAAVGLAELPLGAPVEVDVTFAI